PGSPIPPREESDVPAEAKPDDPLFTGVTTDSLGRTYHWVDGKRVPGPKEFVNAVEGKKLEEVTSQSAPKDLQTEEKRDRLTTEEQSKPGVKRGDELEGTSGGSDQGGLSEGERLGEQAEAASPETVPGSSESAPGDGQPGSVSGSPDERQPELLPSNDRRRNRSTRG